MNVLVMISYFIYMYVYTKCVLTNDFMQSASSDSVHCRVGLGGATIINWWGVTNESLLHGNFSKTP